MQLNVDQILQRSSKVAWQQLDDKVIIVTPKDKQIHILSGSGMDIWQALEEPKTIEALFLYLYEIYDVAEEQLECQGARIGVPYGHVTLDVLQYRHIAIPAQTAGRNQKL